MSCFCVEAKMNSEHPLYLSARDTTMTPFATIPSASMENFVGEKRCCHIIDKVRQIVGMWQIYKKKHPHLCNY